MLEVTKPGFSFIVFLYISFDWWMCAFVVLGLLFPYQAWRLAWGTCPKWPILCRVGCKTTTQSTYVTCQRDRNNKNINAHDILDMVVLFTKSNLVGSVIFVSSRQCGILVTSSYVCSQLRLAWCLVKCRLYVTCSVFLCSCIYTVFRFDWLQHDSRWCVKHWFD